MNFSIFFWLILINFHIVFYDGDSGAFFACASIVFACQEIRAINHVFFCWNTFMHVTKPFYSSFLMFSCILLFFLTYFYMIFLLFFTSNFGEYLYGTLVYSRWTSACIKSRLPAPHIFAKYCFIFFGWFKHDFFWIFRQFHDRPSTQVEQSWRLSFAPHGVLLHHEITVSSGKSR